MFDVKSVWIIENEIKTNRENEVIQYMMGNKRKVMCLPYGNLIIKILEHTEFNFENEELVEDVTKIGEPVLEIMRYEIIYEKVIVKPSKENKRNMDNQETRTDLEDLDYDIPQLPLTKHLLKIIIKKLYMINDKIDFLTRHFIKDPRQLPSYLSMDDDFDEE